VRPLLAPLMGSLLALATAAPAGADEAPFLRGPHPFLAENEVSLQTGYGMANYFSGVRASAGYGFQAAGSLWLDLHVDLVDAQRGPELVGPKCAMGSGGPCAAVDLYTDVLAGLKYKLRMNVPVIPYAGLVAGPIFLFNSGAEGAFGLAARASVGARYFLYDWLGFGLELGALFGGAWVAEGTGLESDLRILDLGLGAEVQF